MIKKFKNNNIDDENFQDEFNHAFGNYELSDESKKELTKATMEKYTKMSEQEKNTEIMKYTNRGKILLIIGIISIFVGVFLFILLNYPAILGLIKNEPGVSIYISPAYFVIPIVIIFTGIELIAFGARNSKKVKIIKNIFSLKEYQDQLKVNQANSIEREKIECPYCNTINYLDHGKCERCGAILKNKK